MIPFNKPFLSGKELDYIKQAVETGKISGNGVFTKKCQSFFEKKYNFKKCLLTTSCTNALEMAAILIQIVPGDEVIMPSFTFVSTANAFVLRGAKIVFADSTPFHPNIDEIKIEKLITPKTKAIVVVHYAGVACNMDYVIKLAEKYHLWVIEDAAHAVNSYYKKKPLGGIGHLGCFSFHETKNIQSGEGGMIMINDITLEDRAEIIWEKGTNRSAFFRGKTNKYEWIDIGSSFFPSEITAAYLFAQIENLDLIQEKRDKLWNRYFQELQPLKKSGVMLPQIPEYSTNNAHIFYLVCTSTKERDNLILHLKKLNVNAVFHYLPLHRSPYYLARYPLSGLVNCEMFSERIIRLPMYYELTVEEQKSIINAVLSFYL